jgi:hypothetical protein
MGAVFSRNRVEIIPNTFQGRAACRRGPTPALGGVPIIYHGPWPGPWPGWLPGGRSFQAGGGHDAGKNLICPPISFFSLHSNSLPARVKKSSRLPPSWFILNSLERLISARAQAPWAGAAFGQGVQHRDGPES